MDSEVNSMYKFHKSFKERYDDYYAIFHGSNNKTLSIHERWSHYLEFSFSLTSHGWNAYWNILRTYCDKLEINFPKVVLVRVVNVNYESLSADVSVINTQDDDELYFIPGIIETVPLKDLYVTVVQEKSDLDVNLIAECLDQLRFFYHHLWWSWDDEKEDNNNESDDWVSNHLEHRLKVYFDKLEGNMHYVSAKIIKRLMEKSKEYHDYLKNINHSEPPAIELPALCEMYNEMNSMKIELRQWSIPEIRKLKNEEIERANNEPGMLIVLQENEMQNIEIYLNRTQDILSLENLDGLKIKLISPSFEICHQNYNTSDIILLAPGYYELNYIEYFDFPVSIRGLNDADMSTKTVISDKRSFWSIFQFLASNVSIRNIDFNLKYCRTVFIVKRGVLVLEAIHFNNSRSKDTIGIQLHRNTKLIARRCQFSNFNIAIMSTYDTILEFEDCIFENNTSCVQFVEGSKLTMNNCNLKNTKSIPFIYEKSTNDRVNQEKSVESLGYLSKVAGVTIHQVQVDDEAKTVEII